MLASPRKLDAASRFPSIACLNPVRRGRRPRRPGRADIESATTTVRQPASRHRRGGFHIRPQVCVVDRLDIDARFPSVRRAGSRPPTGDNVSPVRGVGDAAPYI